LKKCFPLLLWPDDGKKTRPLLKSGGKTDFFLSLGAGLCFLEMTDLTRLLVFLDTFSGNFSEKGKIRSPVQVKTFCVLNSCGKILKNI